MKAHQTILAGIKISMLTVVRSMMPAMSTSFALYCCAKSLE
jgi:hypothetical protein